MNDYESRKRMIEELRMRKETDRIEENRENRRADPWIKSEIAIEDIIFNKRKELKSWFRRLLDWIAS